MESNKEVNTEKAEQLKKYWNEFTPFYEEIIENITIQSGIILYSLTNASRASKICEVGAGCGKSSRMFISEMLRDNSIYTVSDLSDDMNQKYVDRFNESPCSKIPNLQLKVVENTEGFDLNKIIEEMGEDVTRKIIHSCVNNESLPYPDEFYDLYLSSLSMMIVDNHHNQLSEAYRVLKSGGTAGFTVWGRPENSSFFTFIPGILKKIGIETPKPARTNFHLGVKEELEKDMREVGFSEVKLFYTQTNMIVESSELLNRFFLEAPSHKPFSSKLSEEQKAQFKEELDKEFETLFGKDSSTPMTWEILV